MGDRDDFSPGSAADLLTIGGCTQDGGRLRLRRGRPCQIAEPERRQLLLDAAESMFLELGYGTASMDDIARRAGMSKKTLYRLFETKESLFAAVIAARRAVLDTMIAGTACADGDTPDEVLRSFLGKVARFVLAPRQAALYRLVIAESLRTPELAHAFYDEGPCKVRAVLEQWLTRQHQSGVLHVADAQRDAGMVCSMVIAELQMRLLVGELRAPDDAQIEATVNRAVDLFLHGARARGDDKKTAGQERG
ncbi:MAG TPA: TetR/AcrR family transcriptional regulator [Micropepsaceae bacterium]|nr:TetR/AcrR family transcriptional regulator [Micropepsaceae bacterium]